MFQVEVKNFQSIEHTVLKIEGFTALVGRSNIGKSALVRAIKAALTGAADDNFVRHGATCKRTVKNTKKCSCYCSVHITAEGFDLLWEKGDDKNQYTFNGKDYTAVGKGTPDFLENQFGLVKIGDNRVLLQVSDQFRHEGGGPIFLLDESGSVVADVLSDVAQLDQINVAGRLADKDRREAVSRRKVREKDVITLRLQVAAYDGLDEAAAQVREVERAEVEVSTLRQKLGKLDGFRNGILTVGRQLKELTPLLALEVPNREALTAAHQKFGKLSVQLSSMQEREAVLARLSGVEDVVPPPVEPLRSVLGGYESTTRWLGQFRRHKELFARWKGLEEVPLPDATGFFEEARQHATATGLFRRGLLLTQALSKLERDFGSVDIESEQIRKEIDDLGVCPTCLQTVTLSHDHAAA